LSIISNLDAINAVIGVDLLSQSLLPAIVDLAEDAKWRVRLAIIEHIPKLAEQLGLDFFNEKLSGLCMSWLGDKVFAVRKGATENLRILVEQFGEHWARENVLPTVERMLANANYLQRMTGLYCMQVLLSGASSATIDSVILPILLPMAGDSVANIRFTVARSLEMIPRSTLDKLHPKSMEDISTALTKLDSDGDVDVRFYATKVKLLYAVAII
jgi:serine/threonine-protein phosphatase 2A regulatory subunit A